MKKKILLLIGGILLSLNLFAQNTGTLSTARMLPNNKLNWPHKKCAPQHPPMIPNGQVQYDTTTPIIHKDCWEDCGLEKQGIDVQIGRNFETNHLFGGYPADNNLAISNSGKIVSVDNSSISYFHENGDSIVQFGLPWNDFYGVSSTLSIFDPKVVYDSYYDRFILVTLLKDAGYTDSRILLSFSQDTPGVDSVSWYHYQIHCDSVYNLPMETDYWFDYPNIGVNKDELFISLNVFDFNGTSSTGVESIIFQVQKLEGAIGVPNLIIKEWKDIEHSVGSNVYSIVPLMEASQQSSYEDTMYFIANKPGTGATYYWFDLFGDVALSSAAINPHTTSTSEFYSIPSYASQMGGNATDRIMFIDARIQGGYYQNGKFHFVHHRSDNGWSEILYGRIEMATNTFNHNTWGGDGTNMNYMYPSIAHFGATTTEENAMITFARTGPSIYNQICVVNYENGWSNQTTVIKEGIGLLDLSLYDGTPETYERIGDYTDIQRKYSSNTCWLIGSYPFGTSPNYFGSTSGTNTWVAEVGNTGVGIDEVSLNQNFMLYPNPSDNGIFKIKGETSQVSNIQIIDELGRKIDFQNDLFSNEIQIELSSKYSGMIFAIITLKNGKHETIKVLINN